jgi:hypothetical protein
MGGRMPIKPEMRGAYPRDWARTAGACASSAPLAFVRDAVGRME